MRKFSKRVTTFQKSFVRRILDSVESSFISFAGGLPDSNFFPKREIESEMKKIVANSDNSIFQYSSAKGYEGLREEISKRYGSNKDEILITSGSQQALDILCKAFIDEGDCIVTESPTYLAAINLFKMYRADILPIELLPDRIDLDRLETVFKNKRVKFFYTIPYFHNPTGWSKEEKIIKQISYLAQKYDVIVIEDNPYGELIYEGERGDGFCKYIPSRTISLHSFSKILVPDFRIGCIRANNDFIDIFQTIKEYGDLQSSIFFQIVTANLLQKGAVSKHIDTLRRVYKSKRDIMQKFLIDFFENDIEFHKPSGGMFYWVRFRDGIDTMKLFEFAYKEGVIFVPGEVFYANKKISSCIRLNFTGVSENQIRNGLEKLKISYEKYKMSLISSSYLI